MSQRITVILAATSGGGTVTAVRGLLHLWHKSGHAITLIRTPDSAGLLREEQSLGVDVVEIPRRATRATLGSAVALIRDASRLRHDLIRIRRAVRDRPDAVVLPFLTGTALVTLAATIGLPNRVIVCERNDTSVQPFGWHVRLLRRLLYPRAAAITVNSSNPAASDLLRRISRGRPVHVVPNPHPRDTRPADPVNSRVILGEGPLRSDLEAQIDRLGLTHRITLTGQIDDPRSYYASAGLFVLPSDYEGTSNVLLEAASAGLPCILNAEIAPPGSAGTFLTAPLDSPAGLADVILQACTDEPMRQVYGDAARRWVSSPTETEILSAWGIALSLDLQPPSDDAARR